MGRVGAFYVLIRELTKKSEGASLTAFTHMPLHSVGTQPQCAVDTELLDP